MSQLSKALPIFKKNGLFLTAYLITFVVVMMLISTIELLATPFPMLRLITSILYLLLGAAFSYSMINYTLQSIRGQELKLPKWKKVISFTANYILVSIFLSTTLIPILLTYYGLGIEPLLYNSKDLIPALWLLLAVLISSALYFFVIIRFGLSIYILADEPKRFDKALKQSWQMSKGNCGRIILTTLLCSGVTLLGMILLFVGMFPACVLAYIIMGSLYNDILQSPKASIQA